MRQMWQRKMPLWQWGCRTFQVMAVNYYLLQVVLLASSLVVEAAVSTRAVPSVMTTHFLAPSSPLPGLVSTGQQLPNAISVQTPTVNSTLTSTHSYSAFTPSMSIQQMQTSQDVMMMLVSTQVDMSVFPTSALPSFSPISMTDASPGQRLATPIMPSYLPKSVLSATAELHASSSSSPLSVFPSSSRYVQEEEPSIRLSGLISSISPTPSASSILPVLTTSEKDFKSTIPLSSSQMGMKSTTLPDKTLVTLLPTPSPTVTESLSTSISSEPFSSSSSSVTTIIVPSTQTPSASVRESSSLSISSEPLSSSVTPIVPSTPTPSYSSILSPSALPTNSLSMMPSQTPAHSHSTTMPSLSSIPQSSSVVLKPTPTTGPISHPPTTEKSTGGLLTMAQWIGVAVAGTAAFIILCVILWWLVRERKSASKHKATYTKDNVTIDYSRSTSTDPKDVWRNSLLLESMSTRIVVPEEDDDEMQAVYDNHGIEGISDEEEKPASSYQKEVPLTKV